MKKKQSEILKEAYMIQKMILKNGKNIDKYNQGLYNGIEIIISMIGGREGIFIEEREEAEPRKEQEKEESGRTVAKGVLRCRMNGKS